MHWLSRVVCKTMRRSKGAQSSNGLGKELRQLAKVCVLAYTDRQLQWQRRIMQKFSSGIEDNGLADHACGWISYIQILRDKHKLGMLNIKNNFCECLTFTFLLEIEWKIIDLLLALLNFLPFPI